MKSELRTSSSELVSRSLATSQRRRNLSGYAACRRFASAVGLPLRLLVVVSVARERSTRSVGSSQLRWDDPRSESPLAHSLTTPSNRRVCADCRSLSEFTCGWNRGFCGLRPQMPLFPRFFCNLWVFVRFAHKTHKLTKKSKMKKSYAFLHFFSRITKE